MLIFVEFLLNFKFNIQHKHFQDKQIFRMDTNNNNISKNEFSLSNLIYKFDSNSLKQKCDDQTNNKQKINANCLKSNKETSQTRMDSRRNAIDFEHNNNLDDDQNSAVNSLILNTIQSSLERNNNDINMLRAVSIMPARFKEAFEGILKTNRIEDFDQSQNFRKIQDYYSNENRFVDTQFRPCNKSIHHTESFKNWLVSQNKTNHRQEFVWKRAKDMCRNPQFAIDETNQVFSVYHQINEQNYRNFFHTTDLDQGCLGT